MIIFFIFAGCFLCVSLFAQGQTNIADTKHNLSVTGPGTVKALTETRMCVFCHTPHNATPDSPLWNKDLQPQAYELYKSETLKAGPLGQPTGPTKLCLSCHDGTIGLGTIVNPPGDISMTTDQFPEGSFSRFNLNLASHHPVSFPYNNSLPNEELVSTLPEHLTFGGDDEVHCTTCHEPHNDTYGKFLLMDNRFSALCISCHQMNGWETSPHATSTDSVVGILPIPPKTWPTYTQLGEWGCETCHTPHFAATPEALLNFTDSPPTPFSCTTAGCHTSEPPPVHLGTVPPVATGQAPLPLKKKADIATQVQKASAHREPPGFARAALHGLKPSERASTRAVICTDCHNPHLGSRKEATPPYVSGILEGVSGVDRNGVEIPASNYQYEICFKCHSDNTPDLDYVPRVVSTTNTRLAFNPSNPSYHPVVEMGKNLNIPSIPSTFEPHMNSSNIIYCTSCHGDDGGVSNGPHGSSYAPILKERYETADNTPESYDNYALCYRCHNRDSILNDQSFRKRMISKTASGGGHSGHLRAGISCAACHDPHGVNPQTAADSGSHTNLINFDTRVVLPRAGTQFPVFRDTGNFTGTCTLQCHGVDHDNFSYP